ncbi:hypothetical protein EOS_27275 [Caballeronia mineralivorans PML1(12)]|uniref:Tetratricopeptide repeat protein n=1 Tax=Caballeronia mineralivorans PML1(12) TaxID=908627 RepID=A0A0J1FTK9_9BURK|nr:tetratricopeptide repeat protein [Caballeronia mineralivorans]KLU23123.1 hypothetical protein EOS_27275 [Caballeronia mineralivorans PML1(12)]
MKLRRPTDHKIRQVAEGIAFYLQDKSPPTPSRIESIYTRVQQFAKYVGIPSLIIAAMMPAYNLASGLVDYSNRTYVQKVQTAYAFELLNKGEIDRANFILTEIPSTEKFDVATFYAKAKVLLKRAIKQGREQDHAQDIASVLVDLYENRPFLFPKVGTGDEIIDLRLDLVEVDIQRGNYIQADNMLRSLNIKGVSNGLYSGRVGIKTAEILTLQVRTVEARKVLYSIKSVIDKQGTSSDMADLYFLLGKTYQFDHDNDKAVGFYEKAQKLYEAAGDFGSIVKIYNNVAMTFTDKLDFEKARFYYELEATLARQQNDNLSLGRALVNIALLDRRQNNIAGSIEHGLEAKAAFAEQGNKLGMAASLQNLANTYVAAADYEKGTFYGKEAILQFRELGDLRGVARSAGVLAKSHEGSGNYEEAYYNVVVALLLNKKIGFEKTSDGQIDATAQFTQRERLAARLGVANAAEIGFRAQKDVTHLTDLTGVASGKVPLPQN